MKTIYVDMDGVLTEFEKRYTELYGLSPKKVREHKHSLYSQNWNKFVDAEQFIWLDRHKGYDKLVSYLRSLKDIKIYILSSSGGDITHNAVVYQKLKWLDMNGLRDWPAIIVPGRRFKSNFANKESFLIDDTVDVVTSFTKHGGESVVHADVDYTIHILKEFI
jgi:hypothetical protein